MQTQNSNGASNLWGQIAKICLLKSSYCVPLHYVRAKFQIDVSNNILAFLFNCFVETGYLPKSFTQSVIPLIKSKSGDLADVNNDRAIYVSTTISKLFESIIAEQFTSMSPDDTYQFGFKSGHSTGICAGILKRTVNY